MTAPPTPRASSLGTARVEVSARQGRLAIALQEVLTTVARLRANKQVATDAESFRSRIKQVLATAEQEGRGLGYAAEDARFALFAVWSSRTLQEEVFGVHMAGELFFQYLQQLLQRQDSSDLADILEVYQLCM